MTKNNNIKLALTSSTSVEALETWQRSRPDLYLTFIQTNAMGNLFLSPDSLNAYVDNDKINILVELGLQYSGIDPDDPVMAPYYQFAADNGIPVCL